MCQASDVEERALAGIPPAGTYDAGEMLQDAWR
jgi:hypothetical protein